MTSTDRDDLLNMLLDVRSESSISEHYGVKNEDYDKLVMNMHIEFLKTDNTTKVVDKYFSELNAEQRASIVAFSVALIQYKLYVSALKDYNENF